MHGKLLSNKTRVYVLVAYIVDNHLDRVLISSDLWLPWECEDAGTKHDWVVDFNILLVVNRVGESVDFPRLGWYTSVRKQAKFVFLNEETRTCSKKIHSAATHLVHNSAQGSVDES